ncbi:MULTISPECIES: iron-containing alcohol dehydrogenase [unclassified Prevotella]|uniref:iron-containing alcohol dehydrogenase n=1 Tax=unclassified Prevotella TaxID=2638335 RepID=UPI000B964006|nr:MULTISPECIES: iron-containing alcohol dehydrogenase [unclassified Prevotella]OYP43094.1 NADH-dependent alcohol dehydrogenase [Prevotella sp. P5-50]OYP45980.1 NADH-dependent alcohol dehydrogenase [Prevotella sp. P4-98]OYP46260.1 NADH-dependent alcohol dehydrogenase [Prevotella sp. P4-119]
MKNFNYYAPTQVAFGRNTESQVAELVKKHGGSKVLIHYGGQSAIRSGLLAKVEQILTEAGIAYVKLGGVKPNPRLSLVRKGIELCKEENVDFLLAVGGGSVIDSCKAISSGRFYLGDVWTLYEHKDHATQYLPIGCILTIPAAGSEMSNGSVITNDEVESWLKKDYCVDEFRCKFAIMNPELTFTLPAWQTACGITDMMMHTMERYFSKDDDMETTDAIAEAILRTCMKEGPLALANPTDYTCRANIMWAGTLAHNDLTGCGTTGDWATHNIEHELSGLFDVSHGAGLAAVWGSWARYTRNENLPRFARFAHNVMGIDTTNMSDMEASETGIKAMEQFFRSIGMPTDIHTLVGKDITDAEIEEMAQKCTNGDTTTIGGLKILHAADIVKIYQMAK